MNRRAIIVLGSMVSMLFLASCGDSHNETDKVIQVDQDIIGDPIEDEEVVGEPILSGNATTGSGEDDNLTLIEEGLVANGERFPLKVTIPILRSLENFHLWRREANTPPCPFACCRNLITMSIGKGTERNLISQAMLKGSGFSKATVGH